MNLLAIDTATSILSVAVCKDKDVFYKKIDADTPISESAMSVIDSLMKEAGLKPNELNGVICMGGPGSFTGLRVGYSIAKGLALSLNIPFVAVPTIEEIIKDCGHYFYKDKRGLARELLEIGKTMDYDDSKTLFSGPEY